MSSVSMPMLFWCIGRYLFIRHANFPVICRSFITFECFFMLVTGLGLVFLIFGNSVFSAIGGRKSSSVKDLTSRFLTAGL